MRRIAIVGSQGKMGKMICKLLKKQYEIVAIDKEDSLDLAKESDLVIDFSTGSNSAKTALWCAEHNKKLIIGATGQTKSEMQIIEEVAKKIPIMKAGNFSQGIALLKQMLKIMHSANVDSVSIIEMHHKYKKDSPSGTAIELAQTIKNEFGIKASIHSIRGGEEIGIHEIKIYFGTEVITISHQVFSREAFAQGVVLASSVMLETTQSGFYNYEEII